MQFTRVVNTMEIWNASSDGFSFVISYESRGGPGFHGAPGVVAVMGYGGGRMSGVTIVS